MIKLKNILTENLREAGNNPNDTTKQDNTINPFLVKVAMLFETFKTYFSKPEYVWLREFNINMADRGDWEKKQDAEHNIPALFIEPAFHLDNEAGYQRQCIVDVNGNVQVKTITDTDTNIYRGKLDPNLSSGTIYNTNNAGAQKFSVKDILVNRMQFKDQSMSTISAQKAMEMADKFKKSFETPGNFPDFSTNVPLLWGLIKQIKTTKDLITVNEAFYSKYKKSVMWWIKEEGQMADLWNHAFAKGMITTTQYIKSRQNEEQQYAALKNIKLS